MTLTATQNIVETDLSIVIVNWNTRELLLECLNAVYHTLSGKRFEVIIVDNGSSDGSIEAVRDRFPQIRCIVNADNRGFAAANNQAFAVMRGRYALLLNTDAILLPGALESLFAFMEAQPRVGMACGQLLNPDGSKQNAFANFPSLMSLMFNESLLKFLLPAKFPSKYRNYDQPMAVDSCIGACMIVRKAAMDQVGGFDERYFFFFEETDWARQFWQKGWQVYFVPQADIIHAQGQSAGDNVFARKLFYFSRYQYLRKWHPAQYPLMSGVIALRLLANVLLNTLGLILTLGLHPKTRMRFRRYVQLAGWLLKGHPFPKRRSGQKSV